MFQVSVAKLLTWFLVLISVLQLAQTSYAKTQKNSKSGAAAAETSQTRPSDQAVKVEKFAYLTYFPNDESVTSGRNLLRSLLSNHDKDYPIIALVSPLVSTDEIHTLKDVPKVIVAQLTDEYLAKASKEKRDDLASVAAWQFIEYEVVVCLGYNMIVQQNLNHLFEQEFDSIASVVEDSGEELRPGLLVIQPSDETYRSLLQKVIEEPPGALQSSLATMFLSMKVLEDSYNSLGYTSDKFCVSVDKLSELSTASFFDILSREAKREPEGMYSIWVATYAMSQIDRLQKPTMGNTYRHEFRTLDGRKVHEKVIPNFCIHPDSCVNADYGDVITLVTQMSIERVSRLAIVSKSWKGPLSVAIWMTEDQLASLLVELLLHQLPFDRLDLHLVIQPSTNPYPINMLRNVAMKYAKTDMVLIYDIDFDLVPESFEKLSAHKYIADDTHLKFAYVIPPFEYSPKITCNMEGSDPCVKLPETKKQLASHFGRTIQQFHVRFQRAHQPTRYRRWLSTDSPYYVQWARSFEPYVVVRKSAADFLWFDERFVNRGYNKVIFAFELYIRGFRFVVLPDVFIIHEYESQKERSSGDVYQPFMENIHGASQRVEEQLRKKFNCPAFSKTCNLTPLTKLSGKYINFEK